VSRKMRFTFHDPVKDKATTVEADSLTSARHILSRTCSLEVMKRSELIYTSGVTCLNQMRQPVPCENRFWNRRSEAYICHIMTSNNSMMCPIKERNRT